MSSTRATSTWCATTTTGPTGSTPWAREPDAGIHRPEALGRRHDCGRRPAAALMLHPAAASQAEVAARTASASVQLARGTIRLRGRMHTPPATNALHSCPGLFADTRPFASPCLPRLAARESVATAGSYRDSTGHLAQRNYSQFQRLADQIQERCMRWASRAPGDRRTRPTSLVSATVQRLAQQRRSRR